MVNTFLTYPSYAQSAASLDRSRLGKQRVEAYQILKCLEDLRFLAENLSIPPFPINQSSTRDQRQEWIGQVLTAFKPYRCVHIRGNFLTWIPQSIPSLRAPAGEYWIGPNGEVSDVYQNRVCWTGRIDQCLFPGDRVISAGWKRHPAVRMWLGYEDSLRQYINAHINEWVKRGYQNTMQTYPDNPNCPQPSWLYVDCPWIVSCRSNLVQKELQRREPSWYIHQTDIVQHYQPGLEYAWP